KYGWNANERNWEREVDVVEKILGTIAEKGENLYDKFGFAAHSVLKDSDGIIVALKSLDN
ncbi:10153_t:CDS:1, partial [Funneliformis caledonium]